MNSLINIGIILTYIFVGLAIATIVFFAIKALASDFKQTVLSLVGLGVLVLVFVVSFAISGSDDISPLFFDKTDTNPAHSKIIGSGLIMLYIMVAAAFSAIIYAQISRLFKN
jgi:uncharacterized protein YacL